MGRTRVIVAATAAVVLAVPMSARAATPETATGTYEVVGGVVQSVRALPNACFIELNLTMALHGTFEGLLDADLTIFSRGPCDEQMTADELHGQGTFTGSVGDAEGTLRVQFRARHSADGLAEALIVGLTGDGGLSNLRMVVRAEGLQGMGGTYEGSYHFNP